MGEIAVASADALFLTSDNPRNEDPQAIMTEILAGMGNSSRVKAIVDRHDAIVAALNTLTSGDCLLIAGKGHEDYQIVGRTKKHFSDQEEILTWASKLSKATGFPVTSGDSLNGSMDGN